MFEHVYIRGDTHGNFDFLPYFCQEKRTTSRDLMIILGDAGINYYGEKSKRDKHLKEMLSEMPITFLIVRGNHEIRPEDISTMTIGTFEDSPAYTEGLYPNIFYTFDGGIYNINGKTYLAIGGAYSVDKYYRQMMKWNWFENEMLSQEEMDRIFSKIQGQHFDHVLTHTCPEEWQPFDLFLAGLDQSKVEKDMEQFFTKVSQNIDFGHWWFGHFHDNRLDVRGDGKVTMLLDEVIEVK